MASDYKDYYVGIFWQTEICVCGKIASQIQDILTRIAQDGCHENETRAIGQNAVAFETNYT